MKFHGNLSSYRLMVRSIEVTNYHLWSVFHIQTRNMRFYWRKTLAGQLIQTGEFCMCEGEIKADKPLHQFPSTVIDEMWKLVSSSKNWALNNNLCLVEE